MVLGEIEGMTATPLAWECLTEGLDRTFEEPEWSSSFLHEDRLEKKDFKTEPPLTCL